MAEYASKGVAGSGLGLGIAGTALGVLASANNGNGGGILGGLFGNNGCGDKVSALMAENSRLKAENYSDKNAKETYAQTLTDNRRLRDDVFAYITPIANEVASNRERVAVLEATQKCDTEKTILREQLLEAKLDNVKLGLNAKIDTVAQTCGCGISQLNTAVANLQSLTGAITKTVIPKDVICPEVMAQYNSWTAPTAVAPVTQPITGTIKVS